MNSLQKKIFKFRTWLYHPHKVFMTCMLVLVLALFLNGTVWKVIGLYRDRAAIAQQILQAEKMIKQIEQSMAEAKDPSRIERIAHDKLDLVAENDLVFVFPE